MLKIVKYNPPHKGDIPCFHWALFMLGTKSLNDDATLKPEVKSQLQNSWTYERDKLNEILSYAIRCKKGFPNNQVINKNVTQHVLVGKGGNEILRANSFWGMIGGVFVTTILAGVALGLIGLIMSGIGSLFK
ncbi:MAG: hypothetical protein K2H74_08080 [Paramuribaculum sp.]|nr:hypothetical protein [Paramuribaculum sp.]